MQTFVDMVKARLDTCTSCESKSKSMVPVCKECGCIIKLKALIKTEKCPLDKWDKLEQG
jgi:hypothetical protein